MVDQGNGTDLVPVNLFEAHNDSILELAKKMNDRVAIAKNNKDKEHNEITKIATILPSFLLGVLGFLGPYLGQNVGISVPAIGVSNISKTFVVESKSIRTLCTDQHWHSGARLRIRSSPMPHACYVCALHRKDTEEGSRD